MLLIATLFVPNVYANEFVTISGKTNWNMNVSFRYEEVPIRRILSELADVYHFTFSLDRRVDPDLPVACNHSDRQLAEALAESVEAVGLSCCIIRSHMYIGPPDAAGKLLLAIALTGKQLESAGAIRARLSKISTLTGKQFCQPRDILDKLARDAGVRWSGLEYMPFDSWNEFFVSPLTLAEQMQLILIGFNVRFEMDASSGSLRPVKLDDGTHISRDYELNSISNEIRKECSLCQFQADQGARRIRATGTFTDIAKLEYLVAQAEMRKKGLSPSASRPSGHSRNSKRSGKETTGMIENKTLSDVFATLGPFFDVTIKLDDTFIPRGITLETRISCKFNRASRKQVLDIIAGELNATYRQNRNEIVFSSKK